MSEICAVNLVNSYCLPSLCILCRVFYCDASGRLVLLLLIIDLTWLIYCTSAEYEISSSDYHRLNVIWNNAFRKFFHCCWRESVSCLLYYCKVLPLSYTIHQRKIFFWTTSVVVKIPLFVQFLFWIYVRLIKLTYVGFRAHVKIASRIVSYQNIHFIVWVFIQVKLSLLCGNILSACQ